MISNVTNMIPEDIRDYLRDLISKYPTIREIWLFGSRANPPIRTISDWDFLVFADVNVLDSLKKDVDRNRLDIDLSIVYDGNHFVSPWPRTNGAGPRSGTLYPSSPNCPNFNWRLISKTEARYLASESTPDGHISLTDKKAFRIDPGKLGS